MQRNLDIAFIEEMPLGQISDRDRGEAFLSSAALRERLEQQVSLLPGTDASAGPARFWRVPGYDSRVGFISPHSQNFCATCNRVRLTVEGRLLLCLGNEHSVDLKAILRAHPHDDAPLQDAIVAAMAIKPERHHFSHEPQEQLVRFMNMTGG